MRALSNETRRPPFVPESLEKLHGLWLRAKKELTTRCVLERRIHEPAAEALSLVQWVHEDLTHTSEQIAIGKYPYRADERVIVPSTGVHADAKGASYPFEIVVSRPNGLRERNECLGGKP